MMGQLGLGFNREYVVVVRCWPEADIRSERSSPGTKPEGRRPSACLPVASKVRHEASTRLRRDGQALLRRFANH
jgi:hypothetical protein